MPSIRGTIASLLAGLALAPSLAETKSIYAHYMVCPPLPNTMTL
jgi:hypothetical protein